MAVAAAVPGAAWPGFILPGQVLTGSAPSGYVFNGPETLVYVDYTDLDAGHTLVASPGGRYRIYAPSPVLEQAVPPADGLWSS